MDWKVHMLSKAGSPMQPAPSMKIVCPSSFSFFALKAKTTEGPNSVSKNQDTEHRDTAGATWW